MAEIAEGLVPPLTGTAPENSPLQGLINCLKEILVPGPQHRGTAPDLPPSLPGLSVLKQTRAEVEPGSLPCPGESLGTWPAQTKVSTAPGKLRLPVTAIAVLHAVSREMTTLGAPVSLGSVAFKDGSSRLCPVLCS